MSYPNEALQALTIAQIKQQLAGEPEPYVIQGFLPANDISVMVGDSGLGKTPLAYQLGICVAAGVPFLDMKTNQGVVLYIDLENGRAQRPPLAEDICEAIGVTAVPDDFRVVEDGCNLSDVAGAIKRYAPRIVLADTLRALEPSAEDTNSKMGLFLKQTREITQAHKCAALLLHHINKPRENDPIAGSLAESNAMYWLNKASGARALINQSNARIGIDSADGSGIANAALIMKWFVKLQGESDNVFIERVIGENGEPIGYKRVSGLALLGNREQATAFVKLPSRFTFKEAMQIYGRDDKPTRQFLKKCIAAGVLRQPQTRGPYEKVEASCGKVIVQ